MKFFSPRDESASASLFNAKNAEAILGVPPSVSPSTTVTSPSSFFSKSNVRDFKTCFFLVLGLVLSLVVIFLVAPSKTTILFHGNVPRVHQPSQHTMKALMTSSLILTRTSSRQSRELRRPLPSADATVLAETIAFAAATDDNKTAAEYPLAKPRQPLLTNAELLTLQYYARDSVYAEWGSGASTTLVAPMARRAFSIENQKAWCDEMLASVDVDFWIKNDVLVYMCVDTGPTGAFGTPTEDANPGDFTRYLSALDDAAAAVISATSISPSRATDSRSKRASYSSRWSRQRVTPAKESNATSVREKEDNIPKFSTNAFTAVLVDGRFRVACALKALWHLDHDQGVLLIHDWTQREKEYHAPILKRYRLLRVVDRLAVLVPSSTKIFRDENLAPDDLNKESVSPDDVNRWWLEAAAELDTYSRDPDRKKS